MAEELMLPTQRERWEARIRTLENTVCERDQLITELEGQLRSCEAEIETLEAESEILAETTITELDLVDAIHDIARALDLQDTGDMHPLHLARACRTTARELRQATEHDKKDQSNDPQANQ